MNNMTIEQCKIFINDPKYKDVVEYFLSAFKRIDVLNDKLIQKVDLENMAPEKYEDYGYLLEDIGEVAVRCIDLLERAYYD